MKQTGDTRRSIKRTMSQHNAGFSKKLGQNFLADRAVIEEIAEGAHLCEKDHVVEIGPGIGVLTCALAQRAGFVSAVEIDGKLIPILEQEVRPYNNVEIIHQDILKTDVNRLHEEAKARDSHLESLKIVGNLPYYITTPIIMKLLEGGVKAESITVMMQKEVAERLMASPGSRVFGAISVAVQYYCQVSEILQVPKECFIPVPKVDSTVIRMDLRKEKPVTLKDEALFFRVVKAGFSQRRKTLLNTLTGFGQYTKEEMRDFLLKIEIDPARRAETLSLEEFARIANQISVK